VELRTGINASEHCLCNNKVDILNCGKQVIMMIMMMMMRIVMAMLLMVMTNDKNDD
jgi:hypothetical protein